MVRGRGTDHVHSRLVKYQGRAKISATLLDVYKRSSIFRVLSHGSAARIGAPQVSMRVLCAERERCYTSEEVVNCEKPVLFESSSRSTFLYG